MDAVTYEEFGSRFVETAVTVERVMAAVAGLGGDRIDVGPMTVGPGGAASVVAHGTLSEPVAVIVDERPRRFDVSIPAQLELDVTFAGSTSRFEAELVAHLFMTVQTVVPLALHIDIAAPRKRDIELVVRSSGWRAKIIGRLGDVEMKIREQVVEVMNERINTDAARAACLIEFESRIDQLWEPPG